MNENSSCTEELLPAQTLGVLVARDSRRVKVFDDFNLDFCCGGQETLRDACRRKELDLEEVLQRLNEIKDLQDPILGPNEAWHQLSLIELVDNIESTHHSYLKRELPILEKLSSKVAKVHGKRDSRLLELAFLFRNFKQELEQHTFKEEVVLFPYIRDLASSKEVPLSKFGTVANPISCMETEHDSAASTLTRIRDLTGEFTAPENACDSWRSLYQGLKQLDGDLRVHIHKENNLLFPGAVALEEELGIG